MRKTKCISIAALCASLGVVFLYLGAVLSVLDMSAAILSSILILFCVLELGYGYAGMVYHVITILALLLLTNKSAAILFAGLFGYAPITKFLFEKKMKRFAWIPKIFVFNLIFAITVFFGAELLGFSAEGAFGIPPFVFYIAYFVLANVIYVICDILYGRVSRVYFYRYRDKIRKYLK